MKPAKVIFFQLLLYIVPIFIVLTSCAESGKDTDAQQNGQKPKLAIQAAVISGNLEAVKQHIEAGTDLNEKDPLSGSTPLISAATFDQSEITKALIDAGADLSIKNNDGSTALHTAAFFCRTEIVQLLLDANADQTVRNNFGATPRETVLAPFKEMKPIYELLGKQLAPLGLQLDLKELEQTRPAIAAMLQ